MIGFMLLVLLFVVLILLASVVPQTSGLRMFELTRRTKAGDEKAIFNLLREDVLRDVISLQRIVTAVAMVIFVIQAVVFLGWSIGLAVSIVAALTYNALARIPVFHTYAQNLYNKYEARILPFVKRHQKILWWFRAVAPEIADGGTVHSKAELQHIIDLSGDTLSQREKSIITNSLTFEQREVKAIMTPRSVADSIKKTEILGPLVLDSLHKTGHSRFPVIDGDLDHVIGVLHLRDVLTLDTKRKHTATAETAMDKHVYYIHEDQPLVHALTAFLKTHHHLFIVVNEFRETVGILTLEDTMEALLGRKIVDEFDTHEDLRAVAARKLTNNLAAKDATRS